ncbi:hypothetical protein C8R43DRAFT_954269 [Mycena crocata]|nr:hypothetical protein C8R43DRAFT_954269 [Mycena crocata]
MKLSLRANEEENVEPEAEGHLSASWEIAVVVALILLLIGVVSTVIWHSRRTRRRRQLALLRDAEATTAEGAQEKATPSAEFSQDVSLPKPPPKSLKTSFDSESKRSPRYYWDHRFLPSGHVATLSAAAPRPSAVVARYQLDVYPRHTPHARHALIIYYCCTISDRPCLTTSRSACNIQDGNNKLARNHVDDRQPYRFWANRNFKLSAPVLWPSINWKFASAEYFDSQSQKASNGGVIAFPCGY